MIARTDLAASMTESFDRGGRPVNLSFAQHNPLISRGAGRQIIQIPFDDSIDGSFPLECFFQMPSRTHSIRSARVWVQAKPFRQYVSASSSSGSGTAHTHGVNTSFSTTAGTTQSQSTSSTSSGDTHSHTDHAHQESGGLNTAGANPLLNAQGGHGHTFAHTHAQELFQLVSGESPVHTHTITTTLTPGIFETAASGTLSLFVANDGVTYGSAITSGVAVATGISNLDIKAQLTKASGDKRIKIVGTGKCRLQVLLLLDIHAAVFA